MSKPEPVDKELYEKIKEEVNKVYEKNSAYRSGQYVKKYKEAFSKKYGSNVEPYKGDKDKGSIGRWFKESWENLAPNLTYPVYRPTKRISQDTPLTINEIDKKDLKKQIKLKQKIKGEFNLPPFKKK